jgi:hypothetical protein
MQAWIRGQDPERIGTTLHERFTRSFADGTLITPEHSASVLTGRLAGDGNGVIWDVSSRPVIRALARPQRDTRLSATRQAVAGSSASGHLRDRGQQAAEVLAARPAGSQVGRHTGVAAGRVGARGQQVNVDVQDAHGLLAPDVGGIGVEEALERGPVSHRDPSFPSSR